MFLLVQFLRARASNCVPGTGFEFFCRFQAVSEAFKGLLGVAAAYCLGAAALGVFWVWTLPHNPPCPECGGRSRTDYGICKWCGYNFLRPPPPNV